MSARTLQRLELVQQDAGYLLGVALYLRQLGGEENARRAQSLGEVARRIAWACHGPEGLQAIEILDGVLS